ncbi:MAG: helix-turn-helix transcriptional regulator [bacterium]|nr:helix-turn-helix transcriptional regulator [bacterium]
MKKYLSLTVLSLALAVGLILNVILEKEFFHEMGFDNTHFVMAWVLFILVAEIAAEILAFSLKKIPSKIYMSILAVALIAVSIFSMWGVRIWKSENAHLKTISANNKIDNTNNHVKGRKQRLEGQQKELSDSIETNMKMMKALDEKKDKWLINLYRKTNNKLIKQKNYIVKQLNALPELKDDSIKKVSMITAFSAALNISPINFERYFSLSLAVLLKGINIMLAFCFSKTLSMSRNNDQNKSNTVFQEKQATTKTINNRPSTNQVTIPVTPSDRSNKQSEYIKKLRGNMTQERFAGLIGITRSLLAQFETDRKEADRDIIEKMEKLAS